jgi:hypothetical protein
MSTADSTPPEHETAYAEGRAASGGRPGRFFGERPDRHQHRLVCASGALMCAAFS